MELYESVEWIENGFVSSAKKHILGKYKEHGHDFFELEYVISGTGEYIIDGVMYKIEEGMLFFISPSNFHSIKNADAQIINVMFSCNICDTKTLFSLYSPQIASAVKLSEEDRILIEKLLVEIVKSKNVEYSIQFLRCVLYKLSQNVVKNKTNISRGIQQVLMYILENFRTDISLADAARVVNFAPAYLSTLFRRETGINFKTYVDNLRFDYAVKLLEFTKLSVLQICAESGFVDYANFVRRFKVKYGCTPSEYRKNKALEK